MTIALKKKTRKPGYTRKLEQYKAEYEKFFGNDDIRTINTDRIMSYYESLIGTCSNKTIYNKVNVLHSFMSAMLERDVIHSLPKFPKIKISKHKPEWIDKSMQEIIIKKIPAEHHPIFRFLFMTGVRPSEARALHWTDIDLQRREIIIRHNFSNNILSTTKTDEERIIPITDELQGVLSSFTRRIDSPYVFTLDGKPYYDTKLGKLWRAACKEIGIEGVPLYNGTRHSFASQKVNAGASLEIIGKILGHSDMRTTQKYAHVSIAAMRKAMEM